MNQEFFLQLEKSKKFNLSLVKFVGDKLRHLNIDGIKIFDKWNKTIFVFYGNIFQWNIV